MAETLGLVAVARLADGVLARLDVEGDSATRVRMTSTLQTLRPELQAAVAHEEAARNSRYHLPRTRPQ